MNLSPKTKIKQKFDKFTSYLNKNLHFLVILRDFKFINGICRRFRGLTSANERDYTGCVSSEVSTKYRTKARLV